MWTCLILCKFITDVNFITLVSKCYYRWDLYYAWVQMLLQLGSLLRLGPKVITEGTFITLGSIYYTCAFYKHLTDKLLHFQNFTEKIPYRVSYKLNSPDHDMAAYIKSQLTMRSPISTSYLASIQLPHRSTYYKS